jgi:hypothetical protein
MLQTISEKAECLNRVFTVKPKAKSVKAGFHPATFNGMGSLVESDTSSPYYPFWFTGEKGESYLGFGNQARDKATGRELSPNGGNKLGRFLMGLTGKPLTEDTEVNPADYVGKRYMLVYAPGYKTDRVSLQSFTPID